MKYQRIFLSYMAEKIHDFLHSLFQFYIYFSRPTPMNNKVKAKMLKAMGAHIGARPVIYQGVWIDKPYKFLMGDDVDLSKDVTITAGGEVTIGNRCLIGYGAKILSTNHVIPEDIDVPIRFSGHERRKVVIEDDVWICSNVVILAGVKVGKGAVVTAGAVATKDVEPYTIVGGVPAKLIRKRTV